MDDPWAGLRAAHRAAVPRRPSTPGVHAPSAAVLACSDARVPPSVVFDQPAGELFVVRVAGNTPGPAALASLDYAVDVLGVDLLVVLGHTECGAVAAAAEGRCAGVFAPITSPICDLVAADPDADLDEISVRNVARSMARLAGHRGPIGRAARTGRLAIVGAVHDIRSGALREIPVAPVVTDSVQSAC